MNVVEKSYPELRKIVNELKIITDKPVFMTGSGPTLVVLLNNEIEETKLNEFKNKYSDIYIQKHKII
jgi:4-diphosphocytidyl-2C-methyl-D-erythritol kinase